MTGRLATLAMPWLAAAALAAEPAAPAAPNGDFEAAAPWEGWELSPPEPRETGRAEWERLALEFTAPTAGRVALELAFEGAGRVEFDAVELYDVHARSAPVERRAVQNAGFEDPAPGKPEAPAGWELSGAAARAEAPAAFEGGACLRLDLAKRGSARARQEFALDRAGRCLLVIRLRGEVLAGSARAAVRVAGQDAPAEPLAACSLAGSTLAGGRGLCGRLSAARGAQRVARLDLPATPGRNYTLEMLVRGEFGDRSGLKAEVCALDDAGTETLAAAAALPGWEVGPDWRPLRVNFPLRGARRVRLTLRLDGPAVLELDNLRLGPPRIVPAPRRFAAGDADDNFRPKNRRPLFTSGGRRDAELARTFTAAVGESLSHPQSFWSFWRSSKAFEHQAQPFAAALEKGLEPGSACLLDPGGAAEAKWLAERAVTVPDHPGAYAVAVSGKELVVAARSPEGFLAAASALSWLAADGPEPELCAGRLEDWPSFAFRAAALDFDGRLSPADRARLGILGAYRLSHLVVTGEGCWRLGEPRVRADARELAELARAAGGLSLVPFLDALGAAPELVRRVPQAAEAVWQQNESHYLRGTERSYLAERNVVIAAGAPVEVAAADGKVFAAGRDYRLDSPPPRFGAAGAEAPRSALARVPGGDIPDGARVTASYNALPPAGETPAACPRSEEALAAFREALAEAVRLPRCAGAGLGGAFAERMRTDRRTASTRFKNGRLLADRVAELAARLEEVRPGGTPLLWADLVNPCSALKFPDDSPAACADLIDPALRRKLVLLVALAETDEEGRGRMARSAAFLVERGYRLAGSCGARGASAARAWAEQLARVGAESTPPAGPAAARGECLGMMLSLRDARLLDLEAFAEAAWRGAEPPPSAPAPAGP